LLDEGVVFEADFVLELVEVFAELNSLLKKFLFGVTPRTVLGPTSAFGAPLVGKDLALT
jgi:hypothetical protein